MSLCVARSTIHRDTPVILDGLVSTGVCLQWTTQLLKYCWRQTEAIRMGMEELEEEAHSEQSHGGMYIFKEGLRKAGRKKLSTWSQILYQWDTSPNSHPPTRTILALSHYNNCIFHTLHQYLQLLFPRELTEALLYCQQATQAYSLKKPGWISIYKGWVVAIAITDAEL